MSETITEDLTAVILAGIPGSGKTTYARHLASHHSYSAVFTDEDSSALQQLGRRGRTYLDEMVSEKERVVVEWGFRPEYLPLILRLRGPGTLLVWFECSLDRAEWNFRARPGFVESDMSAFNFQLSEIRRFGLPTPEFLRVRSWNDRPTPS